ncbi:tyrosine-type recombinase/integrase [Brevibacillus brevis]|uniref:tyrosine-type recombinase/integrase n=1 Tax=Brevibacillus brevis TaxID=1393 RepID=UPI001C8EFDBF|nr:tyrosine-type recombinase/integrase [Brevibacillus brevis]
MESPRSPRNLNRTYKRFLKSIGVSKIRFQDLRHAHATLLLIQGVNPKVESESLGHASIRLAQYSYSFQIRILKTKAARLFTWAAYASCVALV